MGPRHRHAHGDGVADSEEGVVDLVEAKHVMAVADLRLHLRRLKLLLAALVVFGLLA